MKKTIWKTILCAMLVTLTACILCIGAFAAKCTCIKSGCTREAAKGSAYCWVHKPTKSNSSVFGSGSRPSGIDNSPYTLLLAQGAFSSVPFKGGVPRLGTLNSLS